MFHFYSIFSEFISNTSRPKKSPQHLNDQNMKKKIKRYCFQTRWPTTLPGSLDNTIIATSPCLTSGPRHVVGVQEEEKRAKSGGVDAFHGDGAALVLREAAGALLSKELYDVWKAPLERGTWVRREKIRICTKIRTHAWP